MEIRYINEADNRNEIRRIYSESWKHAYRGIVPQEFLDAITEDQCGRAIGTPGVNTMICIEDGRIIGTCSFCKSRFGQYPDSGEVMSIYFLPEYMGKGYGSKLIKAVLDELEKQGFKEVFLWTLEENDHARQFYERNGFSCTGEYLNDNIGGKDLKEVRYVCSLI